MWGFSCSTSPCAPMCSQACVGVCCLDMQVGADRAQWHRAEGALPTTPHQP